jgi:GTP cyclohydrolase I
MRDEDDNGLRVVELPVRGLAALEQIFAKLMFETFGPLWATDPGLMDTPARMARAWVFKTSGYTTPVDELLKTFPAPRGASEMIVVRDIEVNSLCEHHGEAIFGTATVAYIPNDCILGLSKMTRIVDAFARKLQVQERLTNEIADALFERALRPAGVGVIIKARHMCMEARGICKRGQTTVTCALRGAMMEGNARAEFLALAAG